MRFREWSKGEGLLIANEDYEGAHFPKMLQEVEVERFQFLVHAAGNQQHDELYRGEHEQEPEREPSEHGKCQRVEQPDKGKGCLYGLGKRAVCGMDVGHGRNPSLGGLTRKSVSHTHLCAGTRHSSWQP